MKQSISTGFDAEILTALVAQDVMNGSNPFENFDEVVKKYVDKYPQMLKQSKPKPTSGIAPSNQETTATKEQQQRERYFGNAKSDFWKGSGVRNN